MFRAWCGVMVCVRRGMCVARSVQSALQPQCAVFPAPPRNQRVLQHLAGTAERAALTHDLTTLSRNPDHVPIIIGAEKIKSDDTRVQVMPFDYRLVAAYYQCATAELIAQAMCTATTCQPNWERTSVEERCSTIERGADLLAGEYRQRVIAAAMIGQGMTAIQAELNMCQLIDYLRFGCFFMRDLTKSRCVVSGGEDAINRNQYHGLEGFWAAITPYNSLAQAVQLAVTPAIIGNCVVWKPSEHSVLACYRVLDCLLAAGLPPGVINFVPADEKVFLNAVTSNPDLAGISFAGTTPTLEHIFETVGHNIRSYARFPRIVGTGSGKNFHVVHSSANIPTAVACTTRAAFEMAGQKTSSCSRVFVAQSILQRFTQELVQAVQNLTVCHPLDYRCFTSALGSQDAFDKVCSFLHRAERDSNVDCLCGGRTDGEVGYFVEPTVVLVREPTHELLSEEVRGPVLALCAYPDHDPEALLWALSQSRLAVAGSVFARDMTWARWAVESLRDLAATLYVNDRCSEELPGQQSVGGTRKSAASSAKAGSISYLLQFGVERSLKQARHTAADIHYKYMDEPPTPTPAPTPYLLK